MSVTLTLVLLGDSLQALAQWLRSALSTHSLTFSAPICPTKKSMNQKVSQRYPVPEELRTHSPCRVSPPRQC